MLLSPISIAEYFKCRLQPHHTLRVLQRYFTVIDMSLLILQMRAWSVLPSR